MKRLLLFALASLLSVGAFAQTTINVGSKKFTESYVLGEIAKALLEKDGFKVDHKRGMGGTIILWQALTSGSIDCYPEYTGTIGEEILKKKVPLDHDSLTNELKPLGIGVGHEIGFNNTYALVMKKSKADQLGISKLSDLPKHPELRIGPTPEFLGRKDGWQPLAARYGFHFNDVRGIEHGLGYKALNSDQIDIKDCYSTDAEISEYDLKVLQDDLNFFPQYKAVFLYRLSMPAGAVASLEKLSGKIDESLMTKLNSKAKKDENYAAAAQEYFKLAGSNDVKVDTTSNEFALGRLTVQHLTLVGVSLFAAILIGIPLGIAASRRGAGSQLILGVTGVIQTIPSLALLALLIPVLGVGAPNAMVALFLYSLLPIVRNTATGLQDIPLSIRESAAALGMEPFAQLRKVFLPIASRTILAGIKTSAVINVGTATLAGLIGGGGYGEPIQSGLNLNNVHVIMEGAIPAAVLAILVQVLFDLMDRFLIPKGMRLTPQSD